MLSKSLLQKLARKHGTPLFVIDHDELRKNYRQFRKYLPRVQVYFAVKANSDPAIVRTLFKEGSSFDVASMPEFKIVHENIKHLSGPQFLHVVTRKGQGYRLAEADPIAAHATSPDGPRRSPGSVRPSSRSDR